MKTKITLSLLTACSALAIRAQVILSEDFTSPFSPAALGWTVINNSAPSNTVSWAQGNSTGGNITFAAFNGNTNDFYCADFLSVPTGSGGISAWLISPVLSIYNGAVLQFATKAAAVTPVFADRMQVRMSQVTSAAIPSGSASVGPFTTLLLDINPNLTTGTSSVVSNGTVNGYPQAWTVYSLQISGITGTVSGRFAFRYYVDNGGSSGTNSRMIGLDAVRYTQPCGPSVNSYTVCAGTSVTLVATGGLPATTYQWSSGGTSASEIVTPTVTSVYTLTPGNGTIACGTSTTATVTIGSQLSMSVSASASSVCAGRAVTLTAQSAAASYVWSTGATGPVITVTPNATSTYSIIGANSASTCAGNNFITITALPNPTLAAAIPTLSCPGNTISVNATGASTFVWVSGTAAVAGNPLTVTNPTNTTGGNYTLGLIGLASNGCSSGGVLTVTVSANPVLSVSAAGNVQCVNKTATISANGADTYTWSGATTSNASTVTFSNGATAGTKTFSVAGTSSTTGCSASTTFTYAVSLCTGIEKTNGESLEASVFPNPFVNELRLSGLEGRVEIYNGLGQLVIDKMASENEILDTSELPKGAYILKTFGNGGEARTIRLLKN